MCIADKLNGKSHLLYPSADRYKFDEFGEWLDSDLTTH